MEVNAGTHVEAGSSFSSRQSGGHGPEHRCAPFIPPVDEHEKQDG